MTLMYGFSFTINLALQITYSRTGAAIAATVENFGA